MMPEEIDTRECCENCHSADAVCSCLTLHVCAPCAQVMEEGMNAYMMEVECRPSS